MPGKNSGNKRAQQLKRCVARFPTATSRHELWLLLDKSQKTKRIRQTRTTFSALLLARIPIRSKLPKRNSISHGTRTKQRTSLSRRACSASISRGMPIRTQTIAVVQVIGQHVTPSAQENLPRREP